MYQVVLVTTKCIPLSFNNTIIALIFFTHSLVFLYVFSLLIICQPHMGVHKYTYILIYIRTALSKKKHFFFAINKFSFGRRTVTNKLVYWVNINGGGGGDGKDEKNGLCKYSRILIVPVQVVIYLDLVRKDGTNYL